MKTWKIVKKIYDGNTKIIKYDKNCICDFIENEPQLNEVIYLTYRRKFIFFWERMGQLSEEGLINLCKRVSESPIHMTIEDIFILKNF